MQVSGDPAPTFPGGVGPHPLTPLHFTAAELAAGLGVDEGLLACLHLQVCVIGQALLCLFSAVGGTNFRLAILWCDSQSHSPPFLPRGSEASKEGGWHLRGKESERCRPAQPTPAHPASPPLPLPAQVNQLGHVVAQLDLHHFTRGIRVPVPRADQKQKIAIGKENPPGRRDPPRLQGWQSNYTAHFCARGDLFPLCLLPKGEILKRNTKRSF